VFTGGVSTASFDTTTGQHYTLEVKDRLGDPQWPQGKSVTGNGGSMSLSDTTGGLTSRFYRVSVE
jgi:hypothetical protein